MSANGAFVTPASRALPRPRLRDRPPGQRPRILMVSPQPFFQARGTPIALSHVLRGYTQLGYDVDLLTFPVGRDLPIRGVRYLRVPNPLGFRSVPVGLSLKKIFLDVLMAVALIRAVRARRYTFIHAVEEATFLATLLVRGVPVLYDMQSSLPEQLEPKFSRVPGLMRLVRAQERWLLRRVDHVIASAGLGERARRLAPDQTIDEWFFPCVDPAVEASRVEELRSQLELDEGPVVVYSGTFEEYQGVGLLLDAVAPVVARHPEASFVLVGAADDEQVGSSLLRIPEPARSRVRILRRQPRDSMPGFLALADVLVSTRLEMGNAPLKIFDYLGVGRPIVATDVTAHRALLDERCARLVPLNAGAMAEGLSAVLGDPELARQLGKGARQRRDEFSTRFAERLRAACERLAERGRASGR